MKRFITLLAVLFIIPLAVHATVSDTEKPLRIYTSGASTEYPIPFDYIDDEDIIVTLFDPDTATEIPQTKDVDYTIVDDTVTYTTAPGSEFYVIIQRDTPYTQEASFRAGQAPPLSRYESAFDKLTYLNQDLNERVERALLIPGSSMLRDLAFPDPAYNAGKGIRFKNDGTGIEGYEVFEDGLTINIAKVSDYASFSAMMSEVGSTQKTIIVDTAVTMTTHGVIPDTMTLDFHRTGCITLGAYNLTFASSESVVANKNKIFNENGSGDVSFVGYGKVYPQWWGALGDGSTDDTTKIQAAIDSLTKGVVDFGSRSYSTDAIIGDSNISLYGEGATLTLRTASTNLFTATSESSISINGINFIGTNNNAATERLVLFDQCSNIRVENCSFSASIIGLQAHACTGMWVSHNKFFDIIRLSTGADGYGFLADTNNSGITFTENYGNHIGRHFCYISAGSSDIVVSNNVATGCHGATFAFNCAGYSPYSQNIMRNLICKGNTVNGISYDSVGSDDFAGIDMTGYISNAVIEGNTIRNVTNSGARPAYGIFVQSSALESTPITNVIVKGNVIETVDDGGIVALNASEITIKDNVIKSITGATASGIYAAVSGTTSTGACVLSKAVIDGNQITSAYKYGIAISGSDSSHVAYVSIGNNTIKDSATYDIYPGIYSKISWIGNTEVFHYNYDDVAADLTSFTTAMHRDGTANYFIMPYDGYITDTWLSCNATMTTGVITARVYDGTGTYSTSEITISAGSLYTTSGPSLIPIERPVGQRIYLMINSTADLAPATLDLVGGVRIIRKLDK